MCTALGIDPYNVTPTALGVGSSSPALAAAVRRAWEVALAEVDMEEEGAGLPSHHSRTGELLTDRQRRGFALLKAALAYFPQDAEAVAEGGEKAKEAATGLLLWQRLSGRGLTVEGVLRAAGLSAADLGGAGGAEEEEEDEEGDALIRQRIRAVLLAEAARAGKR